jgi:hypothetical protein
MYARNEPVAVSPNRSQMRDPNIREGCPRVSQLLEAFLLLSRIPIQSLGNAMNPTLALSTKRQDIGKGISGSGDSHIVTW